MASRVGERGRLLFAFKMRLCYSIRSELLRTFSSNETVFSELNKQWPPVFFCLRLCRTLVADHRRIDARSQRLECFLEIGRDQ